MNSECNYIKLHNPIPWRETYIYLDLPRYQADKIFVKNKIKVNFKSEFIRPNDKYLIVVCTFAKKDHDKFIEAMEELKRNMLLMSNTDYLDGCAEVQRIFSEKEAD